MKKKKPQITLITLIFLFLFLYSLVSSWLKSSTGIAGLKLSDIKHFENPDFFEVPSSPENVPSLPEKVPTSWEKDL